jgi:hypothetical protein
MTPQKRQGERENVLVRAASQGDGALLARREFVVVVALLLAHR